MNNLKKYDMLKAKKEPFVKNPLSTYKTMAMATMLMAAVAAGCEKEQPTSPVDNVETPTPWTTSPVSLSINEMVETLGLATVSTKSYSPQGGDIKSMSFYDVDQDENRVFTLDKERSNADELVYKLEIGAPGTTTPFIHRRTITKLDSNKIHVKNERSINNNYEEEDYCCEENFIYEMKDNEIDVTIENDYGEYVPFIKYLKNTPTSVIKKYNNDEESPMTNFLIETQY